MHQQIKKRKSDNLKERKKLCTIGCSYIKVEHLVDIKTMSSKKASNGFLPPPLRSVGTHGGVKKVREKKELQPYFRE